MWKMINITLIRKFTNNETMKEVNNNNSLKHFQEERKRNGMYDDDNRGNVQINISKYILEDNVK